MRPRSFVDLLAIICLLYVLIYAFLFSVTSSHLEQIKNIMNSFYFLAAFRRSTRPFPCRLSAHRHVHDGACGVISGWLLYQGCYVCQLNADGHANVTLLSGLHLCFPH